jgi:hypothetical protein
VSPPASGTPASPVAGARGAGQCLNCLKFADGRKYSFAVERHQAGSTEVVYEEAAFICDACARACLGVAPWKIVVRALGVAAAGLVFALLLLMLRRLILAILVLILTVARALKTLDRLDIVRDGLHLHHPSAIQTITGLAIRLRKEAILEQLGFSEWEVIFVSQSSQGAGLRNRGAARA